MDGAVKVLAFGIARAASWGQAVRCGSGGGSNGSVEIVRDGSDSLARPGFSAGSGGAARGWPTFGKRAPPPSRLPVQTACSGLQAGKREAQRRRDSPRIDPNLSRPTEYRFELVLLVVLG